MNSTVKEFGGLLSYVRGSVRDMLFLIISLLASFFNLLISCLDASPGDGKELHILILPLSLLLLLSSPFLY